MDGIIDNPWSPGEGCLRFWDYDYRGDNHFCEIKCDEYEFCDIYSSFNSEHPDDKWRDDCLICTEERLGDNRVENEYATTGIKQKCDGFGKLISNQSST